MSVISLPRFPLFLWPDPQAWNIAHVRHWIQWASKEFALEDVNIDDFKLTGRQLCLLKHDDFVSYIPKDHGDIFWTHLELLRKCKFVGECKDLIFKLKYIDLVCERFTAVTYYRLDYFDMIIAELSETL